MDQKLLSLNAEEKEFLLRNALLNQKLVEKDVLDELISQRNKAVDEAKRQIQGICYAVDYRHKKFKVFDTYSGQDIAAVALPGKPGSYDPEVWDTWGTSAVVVDDVEFQKEGDINYSEEGIYGLVIKGDITYFYSSDIYKKNLLARTDYFIFGSIPRIKQSCLPYDMYLAPDHSYICLSNRDEGKIYFFDLKTNSFTKEVTVRAPGSAKAINMAITGKGTIYITDNTSPVLNILEISTGNITKKNLAMGILGNLILSPDETSLYLFTTKPELTFRQISLDSFKEIKNFPLKGEAFSNGDDPTDLLAMTPDKKNILLMTYINDPIPYTPVLTVIDLAKNKAVKRFSIKDETKPVNIAFKADNPVGAANRELEELILENRLISVNKLREIKMSLMKEQKDGELDAVALERTAETEEEDKEVLQAQALDFERRKDESSSGFGDGIIPKKTKHVIIPSAANKHIAEVLLGTFWQKTETDLSEIPEAMAKIDEVAENVRKKLEYYDIDIVKIHSFYEDNPLEAVIQREYVLEMLDEEESMKRTQVKSAPSNCPNCTAPMYGAWECMACGFTIERPEDAIRRKNASADPLANLQRGYFFIADPESSLLMEVDKFHIPVWKVGKESLNLASITDALRLYNRNTLILDTEANRILEVTPKGRVEWEYKPVNPKRGGLAKPSKVTVLDNSNLLVADTENHRVMEIDLEGRIFWEFGKKGEAGIEFGMLCNPTDIQKTYDETYLITDSGNNRVIEVMRTLNQETKRFKFEILWQYGNIADEFNEGAGSDDKELNRPLSAFKDLKGNYLILDAGNQRVIEVNYEKNITWQYHTIQDEEEISILNPLKAFRLKNRDIMIIGNGKAVQVLPDNNSITWFSTLEELSAKTGFSITAETIKKAKFKHGSKSRYIGKVGDKKEEMPVSENGEPDNVNKVKKVNASQYMRKTGESEPLAETEEPVSESNVNKVKKVNASQYMKRAGEAVAAVETEQDELSEEEKKLQAIIEEKKKYLETETGSDKIKVLFTSGAELLKFPLLLTDKNENRILIVNRNGEVLWSYSAEDGANLGKVNSAELTDRKTVLIADSTEVFEVDLKTKKVIWSFSCNARSAVRLKNGNTLISDTKNSRTIEVNPEKEIIWMQSEIDSADVPGYSVKLKNGNVLISNTNSHIVKEVNDKKEIVWSFGEYKKSGKDEAHLYAPEYAIRLTNGNTLIADTRNSRVLEVTEEGYIAWSYGNKENQRILNPVSVKRLKDGNTLIMHTNGSQITEVDLNGNVVWRLFL